MTSRKEDKKPFVPELDLRPISRHTDRCHTHVTLYTDDLDKVSWIRGGLGSIRLEGNFNWLELPGPAGVTDFEHDSIKILRLPLIAVKLVFVNSHSTFIEAYVNPSDDRDFHVPNPGYDPMQHEDTVTCKRCDSKHLIVPEGFYVPPRNPELFAKVRGKKVEIVMGPVFPKDD